jgi:hypothetical protein
MAGVRAFQQRQPSPTNNLGGWDIGVAAIALAAMTTGFWRLFPEGVSATEAPMAALLFKAGLAALGFVAIATRWEDSLRALVRNPLILVLLGLASASAIWAVAPAEALRSAILFVLMWVFGCALVLRFSARELAEICGFAGLFGVGAQFVAHQSLPPVEAFDGDLAFAIMGSAWAALAMPTRRGMWMCALAGLAGLAALTHDGASLGAAIGLILGLGMAQVNAIRGRQGTISVIVTAWVLVALIVGVTCFAMFGADPVSRNISIFFDGLGSHVIIGQGFALAGPSFSAAIGAGLGLLGTAVVGLVLFATLFQALLSDNRTRGEIEFAVVLWFASVGALLASPSQVAILGPVCIIWLASSFSIALARGSLPVKRSRPIVKAASGYSPKPSRNRPTSQLATTPTAKLTTLGLRPKQ